jgi:hypothetical protein
VDSGSVIPVPDQVRDDGFGTGMTNSGFLLDNQNFITKVSLPIKRAASAASGKAEP